VNPNTNAGTSSPTVNQNVITNNQTASQNHPVRAPAMTQRVRFTINSTDQNIGSATSPAPATAAAGAATSWDPNGIVAQSQSGSNSGTDGIVDAIMGDETAHLKRAVKTPEASAHSHEGSS
jgi:hypothetical protein